MRRASASIASACAAATAGSEAEAASAAASSAVARGCGSARGERLAAATDALFRHASSPPRAITSGALDSSAFCSSRIARITFTLSAARSAFNSAFRRPSCAMSSFSRRTWFSCTRVPGVGDSGDAVGRFLGDRGGDAVAVAFAFASTGRNQPNAVEPAVAFTGDFARFTAAEVPVPDASVATRWSGRPAIFS